MPTREGIQHFVDTSEPNGVQPGDEWWNIGTGRYYKRVVFSNGGVGWTEIGQPSLIVNAANTWPLAQAFSSTSATSLEVSGNALFSGSTNLNGSTTFASSPTFTNGLRMKPILNTTPVYTTSFANGYSLAGMISSSNEGRLFTRCNTYNFSSSVALSSSDNGTPILQETDSYSPMSVTSSVTSQLGDNPSWIEADGNIISFVNGAVIQSYNMLSGVTTTTSSYANMAPYGSQGSVFNTMDSYAKVGDIYVVCVRPDNGWFGSVGSNGRYFHVWSYENTAGTWTTLGNVTTLNTSDYIFGSWQDRWVCARINGLLQMYDIRRYVTPLLSGITVSVPLFNEHKTVSGNTYYYRTSDTTFNLYNIAHNSISPTFLLTMTIVPTSASSIADWFVRGDHLYINRSGRLEIYDVSIPTSPILVVNEPGFMCPNANSWYMQGSYLYVITANSQQIKVCKLNGASVQSFSAGVGHIGSLRVTGSSLFFGKTTFSNSVTVKKDLVVLGDLYNPAAAFVSPYWVQSASYTRIGSGHIVLNNTGFTPPADNRYGWAIYSTQSQLVVGARNITINFPSGSGTIALTSQITAPSTLLSGANSWTASNDFNFSAASTDTFVAQRNAFLYVNALTKNASNSGYVMVKYGNHLITGGGGNIQVWDVSRNPASIAPVSVGSNQSVTMGNSYGQVRGTYLYSLYDSGNASTSGIRVNDLRTLSAITFTGTILLGVRPYNYIISGGHIYVLSLNLLSIYKMTGVTSATLVSSTVISTGSYAVMQVIGNTLYFSGGAIFYSYDISSPSAPVQKIANNAFSSICNFVVRGRYAYISDANQPSALITLDLSTLTQSSITSNSPAIGNAASFQMIVHGNRLYVYSWQSDYVFQVNLNNPAIPAVSSSFNNNLGGGGFKGISACIVNKTLFIGTNSTVIPYFILGGSSIHQLEASGVDTDQITVKSDLQVLSDADVHGSLSVMGNQGISGDMIVAGLSTMGSATIGSATMSSATMSSATMSSATITGSATMSSGTVSGTLTGNKITQPNLPFVVNDISRYFDGNTASFPLRKEQSALTSLVTSSGAISSIVSSATQFVVTHSLGTIVPGSYITISGCSTTGYNNAWRVSASTSTTCTVMTPVNLASAPATPGTLSGSLTSIVDSKDVEVILNGQYLDPYVTELRYPWITEWDANGGFKVSGSNLILYNAPVSGDKATVKVTGISQSVQTRRYPFSSATIALGD